MPNSCSQPPADLESSVGPSAGIELGYCPYFQHVIELLGRRWTGVILRVLLNGPKRFSDLRSQIPGLSDRLLVERLQELEHEQLIERTVSNETPYYSLSDRGEDLRSTIDAIASHAERWASACDLAERPGRTLRPALDRRHTYHDQN